MAFRHPTSLSRFRRRSLFLGRDSRLRLPAKRALVIAFDLDLGPRRCLSMLENLRNRPGDQSGRFTGGGIHQLEPGVG